MAIATIIKDTVGPVLGYLTTTSFKQRTGHLMTLTLGGMLVATAWVGWTAVLTRTDLLDGWTDAMIPAADDAFTPAVLREEGLRAAAIAKVLAEVRLETGAARALAFRFHNSTRFLGGGHRVFMSAVAEALAPGVKSAVADYQDVPLSVVEGIQAVLSGICVVTRTDGGNPAYRDMHGQSGVAEVVKCPITDLDGLVIGMWGASYRRGIEAKKAAAAIEALDARHALVTGLFVGG